MELNSTGINNTANGAFALFNIAGNGNIALGANTRSQSYHWRR